MMKAEELSTGVGRTMPAEEGAGPAAVVVLGAGVVSKGAGAVVGKSSSEEVVSGPAGVVSATVVGATGAPGEEAGVVDGPAGEGTGMPGIEVVGKTAGTGVVELAGEGTGMPGTEVVGRAGGGVVLAGEGTGMPGDELLMMGTTIDGEGESVCTVAVVGAAVGSEVVGEAVVAGVAVVAVAMPRMDPSEPMSVVKLAPVIVLKLLGAIATGATTLVETLADSFPSDMVVY